MLVHLCIDCETISINRIAADDDPEMILIVFQSSLQNDRFKIYSRHGINMLAEQDGQAVENQLYGQHVEMYP